MKGRLLIMVILMALVAGAPSRAAPATGTIAGTVTNHTGSPRPFAGETVRLTAYVNGAEQDWKAMTTDARGRFAFTVPADPQRTYYAWLHYKDGEYTSTPAVLGTPGQRVSVAIRVYEPTTDASVLSVDVHHVIVEPGEGAVQVAELLVVHNRSDRTYVGAARADGRRETLRFSLPAGARDVQLMQGLVERAVTVAPNELVDSLGVRPGTQEIAYTYLLPITASTQVLERRVDYPTGRLELFGRSGTQVRVTPLRRQDDVKTDQGSYVRYSGGPLEAGTTVSVALSGLPVRRPIARRVALAIFAALATAALVSPFLRQRGKPGAGRPSGQTRAELIQAVAALDDRYDAGEVPEEEYRGRRARYLEKLRGMAA